MLDMLKLIVHKQNRDTCAKEIVPVNFEESVPPKVSSPLTLSSCWVGSNDTATSFEVMTPCAKRLSVTVRW